MCNWFCKRREEKRAKEIFEKLVSQSLSEERYQDTNTKQNKFLKHTHTQSWAHQSKTTGKQRRKRIC